MHWAPDNGAWMQVLVPFAAAFEAPQAADLPHLSGLLASWVEVGEDSGPDTSLSPPHERALAAAWGWTVQDGLLPLAAVAAADDGIDVAVGEGGWALLSPAHWQASAERVALVDPAGLALDEAASKALFATVRPLFADAGWALRWGAPTRWYAMHPSLETLPSASVDRVAGRSIGPWMNRHAQARALNRLQVEAQMALHDHPANVEREAQGLLPVNSFWVSGTGRVSLPAAELRQAVKIDSSLRGPAIAEDGPAWIDAWRRLDASALRRLLESNDAATRLTLCGHRSAITFAPRKSPLWRRWFGRPQGNISALLARL